MLACVLYSVVDLYEVEFKAWGLDLGFRTLDFGLGALLGPELKGLELREFGFPVAG